MADDKIYKFHNMSGDKYGFMLDTEEKRYVFLIEKISKEKYYVKLEEHPPLDKNELMKIVNKWMPIKFSFLYATTVNLKYAIIFMK